MSGGHFEFQRATLHNLLLGETETIQLPAVEANTLDIDVLRGDVLCRDDEATTIRQMDNRTREERCAENEIIATRIEGIEAQ